MKRIAELAAEQPGVSVAWSGLSYQERLSGGQAPLLYALSLLVIFLCLAALYESWAVPFAVLFAVPLGVFGAMLGDLLLKFVPVHSTLARGALFGMGAHGAGVARANQIGAEEGSIAGLVMVLVGLTNVLFAPLLVMVFRA